MTGGSVSRRSRECRQRCGVSNHRGHSHLDNLLLDAAGRRIALLLGTELDHRLAAIVALQRVPERLERLQPTFGPL